MYKNTVDAPQSQLDQSVRVFEQAYETQIVINAPEYDIVRSYFKDISNSDNIANNFATMLFRISNITGVHVLSLLDDIRGKSKLEVNATMAYYLNTIKSKVTLYGVGVLPTPNMSVQRNIVI
jgi:hypothetical protein